MSMLRRVSGSCPGQGSKPQLPLEAVLVACTRSPQVPIGSLEPVRTSHIHLSPVPKDQQESLLPCVEAHRPVCTTADWLLPPQACTQFHRSGSQTASGTRPNAQGGEGVNDHRAPKSFPRKDHE